MALDVGCETSRARVVQALITSEISSKRYLPGIPPRELTAILFDRRAARNEYLS